MANHYVNLATYELPIYGPQDSIAASRWRQYTPPTPYLDETHQQQHLPELNPRRVRFSTDSASFDAPQLHALAPPSVFVLPRPFTPHPHAAPVSPSLSSTITTLPSTPASTQELLDELNPEQWTNQWDRAFPEPIRTKRKFSFKRAKRLPVRTHGAEEQGPWLVHAAVIDLGTVTDAAQFYATDREAQTLFTTAGSPKPSRSVHFATVGVESVSGDSSEERSTTVESNYTLSRFKFPTPPNCDWTGSFGQLKHTTPPPSPAVLHYKGASFDLVNPHQSLLLGNKDFEEPAEIDGLIDEYFNTTGESSSSLHIADMADEHLTSQGSLALIDGSQPARTLYNNAETARSHILHLQTVHTQRQASHGESGNGGNIPTDPLVNHQHHDQPLTRQRRSHSAVTNPGDGVVASPRVHEPQQDSVTDGDSSLYSYSIFSNPFDLRLSGRAGEHGFDHVAWPSPLMISGSGARRDEDDPAKRRKSADADAPASQYGHDTTHMYSRLLQDYDYTRSHEHLDRAMPDSAPSSPSIEQARGVDKDKLDPIVSSSTTPPTQESLAAGSSQTPSRSDLGTTASLLAPRFSQPSVPPPRQPLVSPPIRARMSTFADCTELPTSHQTYGSTGRLLELSPHLQGSPYPPAGSPALCRHVLQSHHSRGAARDPVASMHEANHNPSSAVVNNRPSSHDSNGSMDEVWEEVDMTDNLCSSEESHANTSAYTENATFELPRSVPMPWQSAFHDIPDLGGSGVGLREGEQAKTEDVARVIHLLKQKMTEDDLIGHGFIVDKVQRQYHAVELHTLRYQKSKAFREATEAIAEEYSNRPVRHALAANPTIPSYSPICTGPDSSRNLPRSSYDEMAYHDQRPTTSHSLHSAMTDPTPLYGQGVTFNASQNTFVTIRRTPSPMLPIQATTLWTPLAASHSDPSRSTDAIELLGTRNMRTAVSSRSAVANQTKLRDLHIQMGSIRQGALTTKEGPNHVPHPNIPTQGITRGWRRLVHSRACDPDCGHMLLDPVLAREDRNLIREQEQISNEILFTSYFCPLLAILLACGLLDGLARRMSQGRVKTIGQRQRRRARCLALPLGLAGWSIIVLLVIVVVYLTRR